MHLHQKRATKSAARVVHVCVGEVSTMTYDAWKTTPPDEHGPEPCAECDGIGHVPNGNMGWALCPVCGDEADPDEGQEESDG